MKKLVPFTLAVLFALTGAFAQKGIIHDAEYYILEAQNGDKWNEQDKEIAFEVELTKGEQRLQTWFTLTSGEQISAYYTYIEPLRVSQHQGIEP